MNSNLKVHRTLETYREVKNMKRAIQKRTEDDARKRAAEEKRVVEWLKGNLRLKPKLLLNDADANGIYRFNRSRGQKC